MKKLFYYLASVATMMTLVVSCNSDDPIPDVAIQGDLELKAGNLVYSHGSQGWVESDKIGIFAISEKGYPQNNYLYTPSIVCPPSSMDLEGVTYTIYDRDSYVKDAVILTPESSKIGFKEGKHIIYAYMPYNEGSKTLDKVLLPNLANQEKVLTEFTPNRDYTFSYLSDTIESYTSTPIDMQFFQPLFSQITLPGVECPDSFVGKKITKIEVSCDHDTIAYADGATYNLFTNEISGTPIKSIVYNIPNGDEITSSPWGAPSNGTSYIMIGVPFEKAMTYEFTFKLTIDGTDYTISGKPKTGFWSTKNNLNMYGIEGIQSGN